MSTLTEVARDLQAVGHGIKCSVCLERTLLTHANEKQNHLIFNFTC